MSVFGSFTYGTDVYGSSDSTINVTFIAQNLLRVDFLSEVVVDAALYNAENYEVVAVADEANTYVAVRSVTPFTDGRLTTDHVLILTDRHSRGSTYTLTVSNLNSRVGAVMPSAVSSSRTAHRTKVDSLMQSLPAFLDRRPGSVVASILGAIGMEDERIGGATRDYE